jgi:hypothetical protein
MKRGSLIAAPYDHLPNSVWKQSEILAEKDSVVRADMFRQFNDGTRLNDTFALRTFPVYRDGLFHGNTNIQMSSSWALAEVSRLRNDDEGIKLVGKQLEWVLGANPFSQSLMYGAGYRFAPHFAYCLKDIVGALPVGMDCMNGDMPHWCATNNATSKEIWVEPVNRFLGTLSVYNHYKSLSQNSEENQKKGVIKAESTETGDGTVQIKVILSGTGSHRIDLRTFNLTSSVADHSFELSENGSADRTFTLKVTDKSKPFVAVIIPDDDPELKKEITGACINPDF